LTDQFYRCLIQVHTLTEARIIQSIKGRGDHSDDDLLVSEQILNFTALVEKRATRGNCLPPSKKVNVVIIFCGEGKRVE